MDHKSTIRFQCVANQLKHRLLTPELNYATEILIFLLRERKKGILFHGIRITK
jgi:hypothetical protein